MSTQFASLSQANQLLKPAKPRGLPFLGVLPRFMRDPLGCLMDASQHGPIVDLGANTYSVNDAALVKYILQENHRNYDNRQTPTLMRLRPLLGRGLVLNEGESWLHQRRLMQPAFHRKRLASLATMMTDEAARLVQRWQTPAAGCAPISISREMTQVTMQIILKSMFSTDIEGEFDGISQAIQVALAQISKRVMSLVNVPDSWPTAGNRAFDAAIKTLDTYVYRIIEERRRSGKEKDDLIGMLLAARDEDTGEGMSDTQLRDEVMTLFLAGHETTANLLTWAWYLISTNLEVEQRLHAELDTVLGERLPTMADLQGLSYTRMIIDETLRLYPIAWLISRQPNQDDNVGGYRVPAGATVLVSPYVIHHSPAYWENPEQFDPERFSPERSTDRSHYAYFPFGGGPRQCIGNSFALMEAQLIIATIAQSYRLRLLPGEQVELKGAITLIPQNPIQMTVHPRH